MVYRDQMTVEHDDLLWLCISSRGHDGADLVSKGCFKGCTLHRGLVTARQRFFLPTQPFLPSSLSAWSARRCAQSVHLSSG